jgi:poly-beta-1,6-N-acetyl-D-glucosamine synthase
MKTNSMSRSNYILVTPAYNEAKLIGATIEAVLAQTVRPLKWVIVDDASSDETAAIVREYAAQYDFIRLVQVTQPHPRDFRARIAAINLGLQSLTVSGYGFIGTLDADVTFAPDYYQRLLCHFHEDEKLGLAGGIILEHGAGIRIPVKGENARSVANAAQLLRRECHEMIGPCPLLPYGAPDTYTEVSARMLGWRARTFDELPVDHARLMSSASGITGGKFRQGKADFSFRNHPLFEAFRCFRRVTETPVIFGAFMIFCGYCWAALHGEPRTVSSEFVAFLRAEQCGRLRSLLPGWICRNSTGATTDGGAASEE